MSRKKPRAATPKAPNLLVVAAAFFASEGKTQQQIGAIIGRCQPEVSRLLNRAEELGYLVTPRPQLHCTPDLLDAVRQRFCSSAELLAQLQRLEEQSPDRPAGGPCVLRRVTIAHNNRVLGELLEEVFHAARCIGVSWGRTISHTLGVLRGHLAERPPRKGDPVEFLPLCGEPLRDRHDPVRYSSTFLADELSRVVNGAAPEDHPTLIGVPAVIPPSFREGPELETILRFVGELGDHGRIFGKADGGVAPLVDRVDTILTSIGVPDRRWRGVFLNERVALGEIREEELLRLVTADLGGIIIPRAGLSTAEKERIEGLMRRWTGIQMGHVRRCARDAAGTRPHRPGVVVLAIGQQRAAAVRRTVELGLVNELVLDAELAEELRKSAPPAVGLSAPRPA